MNLLKADLYHLIKDKIFWVLMIISFVLPPATCIMYGGMGTNPLTMQKLVFTGLGTDILCVIIGIAISMIIGKDYANNTIRNKICYGEHKIKVSLFYIIESLIITLAFILVSIVSSLLFGLFFCEKEFTSDFMLKLLCQIGIFMAFSSIISAVVISTKSTKAGFIVTILVSVILSAVSYLFPILASSNVFAAVISRSLYMTVSNMVINGSNGAYQVGTYVFNNVYLNSILLTLSYMLISTGVTLLVVRKQNYK